MAYQVLALKWRPQKFEEIVGQEHVTRTLQNAISQDRIPHAFLFTGSRGVGKTTTARILAKALICEHGPAPEPCGRCRFCLETTEGRALDVLEIDGASHTGVDNIRELRENAGYAPSSARFKIYIIDEVHMLSTSAFNALLKTLEEPPAHVKFIFATTESVKVPITIQSRCQRFDFRALSRREIQGQLEKITADESLEISKKALSVIAAAAEGSLRDSQTLLDQVLAYGGKKVEEKDVYLALGRAEEGTVAGFLDRLLARDGAACIRILDELVNAGCDVKSFGREVLGGLRDLALLKTSPDLFSLVSASDEGVEALLALAAKTSAGRLQSLFDIFLQTEGSARNTAFPRMMLELAILRAVRLEEVEDLLALTERLERLGLERLGKGGAGTGGVDLPPDVLAGEEERPDPPVPRIEAPPLPEPLETAGGEETPAREDVPGTQGDLFSRMVAEVRSEGKEMVASFLEQGRLTKESPGEIEITFEEGNSLLVGTFKEADTGALLRRAVEKAAGRKVEVRFVFGEKRPAAQEQKKARESDLKKKYRREALDHPLVLGVVEVFQAQIVDVKLL